MALVNKTYKLPAGQTAFYNSDIAYVDMLMVALDGRVFDVIKTGTPTGSKVLYEPGLAKLTFETAPDRDLDLNLDYNF
jgi:hypothetical protein